MAAIASGAAASAATMAGATGPPPRTTATARRHGPSSPRATTATRGSRRHPGRSATGPPPIRSSRATRYQPSRAGCSVTLASGRGSTPPTSRSSELTQTRSPQVNGSPCGSRAHGETGQAIPVQQAPAAAAAGHCRSRVSHRTGGVSGHAHRAARSARACGPASLVATTRRRIRVATTARTSSAPAPGPRTAATRPPMATPARPSKTRCSPTPSPKAVRPTGHRTTAARRLTDGWAAAHRPCQGRRRQPTRCGNTSACRCGPSCSRGAAGCRRAPLLSRYGLEA